jgi:hypothetical protein
LRQEPILGGEAVGPPLKSLATGLGRKSFGSLFGRLHGVSQDRRRRPQTRRLRVRRRLTFLASDIGESLVEFAGQPGLDALGNRISPASGTSRKALRRLSKVPLRSTAAFALVPSAACDVTRPVA